MGKKTKDKENHRREDYAAAQFRGVPSVNDGVEYLIHRLYLSTVGNGGAESEKENTGQIRLIGRIRGKIGGGKLKRPVRQQRLFQGLIGDFSAGFFNLGGGAFGGRKFDDESDL